MIKLKELIPHLEKAIDCIMFYDKNEKYSYIFDLDDNEGINKFSECVLIDWEVIVDSLDGFFDIPILYVTNWK